jgi:hypothetical protein
VNRKTIGRLIGKAHNHLESVSGLRLSLKVGERWREARFTEFDFYKEPGLAIPHHQKVHFALLLVAQVTQLEVAKPEIGPASTALSR